MWEKVRVGCSERTALKQVYYQGWNRSPAQVGCMRQVLQGWCTGKTQSDGMEREAGGGIGMGNSLNPWLIHANVWQKLLQYCKVISLQLIKINGKKKKSRDITLLTKFCIVNAMVFPVIMCGWESWTIKKAERQKKWCKSMADSCQCMTKTTTIL